VTSSHIAMKNSGKPTAKTQTRCVSFMASPSRARLRLSLNLREIGDPMHRAGEAREQAEPIGADRLVGVVDHHAVEKGIDRRAQAGERGHRVGEALLG